MKISLPSGKWPARLLLVMMAFIAAFIPAQAQNKKDGMHKEIREFRIKFVAQEIDLRPDQQKQFVELYDKMMDERRSAFENVRTLDKTLKEKKNPSEEDYKALSDAKTKAQAKAAEITARYDELFSRFLSQKQIVRMKEAEEMFRSKMMEMRGGPHGKKPRK